jgi:Cu/Ag efflux protein CusF
MSMKRLVSRSLMFIVVAYLGIAIASAQQPVQQAGDVSKTATITAIDHTNRVVTLKDDKGNVEDIACGPEVKRFDELKVGDTVTFSYHAAVVYEIAKPGAAGASTPDSTSAVRGQGPKPSGAYTRQQKVTVTVEAIDPAVPSITVRAPNGNSLSAQVKDKKNIEGVKVGDKIDITYTQAMMITVEAPKK